MCVCAHMHVYWGAIGKVVLVKKTKNSQDTLRKERMGRSTCLADFIKLLIEKNIVSGVDK